MKQFKTFTKDKLIIVLLLLLLGGVSLSYWNYYVAVIGDQGMIYPSKRLLCDHFAQSYLKTVREEEKISGDGGKTWEMAVDVETDLYNLCRSELSKESLSTFELSGFKKYTEK